MNNLYIEAIFQQEMKGDKSFTDKPGPFDFIFGNKHYTQKDMRETFYMGIKHGIEIGLRRAHVQGQKIELDRNTENATTRQREFLEKFAGLCRLYNCAIQFHPEHGMTIRDLNP